MDFPRTRRKRIEITLVPLIDVSMFLLIFFMVAGVIPKFEIIPINPPVAESGKPMDEGHILILLGAHGEVIVGDDLMSMNDIVPTLAPQLKANPGKVITIKADASVPATSVIELMDAIKHAGGQNLSLVTQSKEPVHVD